MTKQDNAIKEMKELMTSQIEKFETARRDFAGKFVVLGDLTTYFDSGEVYTSTLPLVKSDGEYHFVAMCKGRVMVHSSKETASSFSEQAEGYNYPAERVISNHRIQSVEDYYTAQIAEHQENLDQILAFQNK